MAAPFTSFKPREGRRGGDKSALASKYSQRPGQGPLVSVSDPGRVPLTACPSLHTNSKLKKPSPYSSSSSSSSPFHEGVAGKRADQDSPHPVNSSSSSATNSSHTTSSCSCLSAMYEARKRQKRMAAAEDSLAVTANDAHFASSHSIAAVTSAAMTSKYASGSSTSAMLTHGGSSEAKKQAWIRVKRLRNIWRGVDIGGRKEQRKNIEGITELETARERERESQEGRVCENRTFPSHYWRQ